MSFNTIIATPNFQAEAKRLVKKYSSLKTEFAELFQQLEANPTLGTSIGKSLYKLRLAVRSKGKGKSGGLRIVTYAIQKNELGYAVYLLTVYDKSEEASINKEELEKIVRSIII